MEKVVAENLKRLMAFHKQPSPTAAARSVGIKQQQIDRILKGQRVRVDTLENLARGYGLEPYQMLIPGLDPSNPQILRAVNSHEDAIYKAFRDALAAEATKGTQ